MRKEKEMPSKPKAKFKVTSSGPSMFTAHTANVLEVPKATMEKVKPDKWMAVFRVRKMKVYVSTNESDRDEAIVEMTKLVMDMLKEPWNVRIEGVTRL